MKKRIFMLLVLTIFLILPNKVFALNEVNIYFFNSSECNYCNQEKAYLEALKERYFNIKIYSYDISSDINNDLMKKAKELYGVSESGIPFTIIGDSTFVGFSQSKKCDMEKKIYEYSYNKYDNKIGTSLLNISYRTDLTGDVQKTFDDSNYTIEETGKVTTTTQIVENKNSILNNKKYASSIILAGVGIVLLVMVLFISLIERKRRI